MLYRIFLIVGILCLISVVQADYTLQIEGLTSTPADSVTTYMGNNPSTPTIVGGINRVYVPTDGIINIAEIYDYSGTAGSNHQYSYYICINNQTDYLIKTLSVSANERVFTNTSMGIAIKSGDYFEIKRVHPAWSTNPATNIIGGYVVVNTSTKGYTIWGQHLTINPANNTVNYFGSRPITASTAVNTNKIYIPASGNIISAFINDYSTVSGSNQSYGYFIERNGGMTTPVMNMSTDSNLRLFNNTGLSLNVNPGDFIEFKRVNPNWSLTPPTGKIVGANAFIDTTGSSTIAGYPLWVQALTSTPTDAQTVYFGNLPKAPITTAGVSKVYIRQDGVIRKVELYCYSGTAGTTEGWDMYVRVNNTQDYLISKINISSNERLFKNMSINIPVKSGDYFEIKSVQPTWATNPATTIYGGYAWMEYGTAEVIPTPTTTTTPEITNTTMVTPTKGTSGNYFNVVIWAILFASGLVSLIVSRTDTKFNTVLPALFGVISILLTTLTAWSSLSISYISELELGQTISDYNTMVASNYFYEVIGVVTHPIITMICVLILIFTIINAIDIAANYIQKGEKIEIEKINMKRERLRI